MYECRCDELQTKKEFAGGIEYIFFGVQVEFEIIKEHGIGDTANAAHDCQQCACEASGAACAAHTCGF
jgi:hypothetical protein